MATFNRDEFHFSKGNSFIDISDKATEKRREIIAELTEELLEYDVFIKDLSVVETSLRDRNYILNIASYLVTDYELYDLFKNKRKLPVEKLFRRTRTKKEIILRFSDQIIAYALILGSMDYKLIRDWLNIFQKDEGSIPSNGKENNHTGIVLRTGRGNSIILTNDGEFISIKNGDTSNMVGKVASGIRSKRLKDFIPHMLVAIAILAVIFGVAYTKFNKPVRKIIVFTTSDIHLDINSFDKVIYSSSTWEKGKQLIESTNLVNKDIDTAIYKILEYANSHEMIPEKEILITITGEKIDYGTLEKTGEYIVENNIKVLINNGGFEYNLSESMRKQKEDYYD